MLEIRARVVSQEKGLYKLTYNGEEKLAEVSGKFRYDALNISDFPAVGDYVISTWPEDDSNGTISFLFPRKSAFIRKAAGSMNEQIVASNIDTIFICMSLNHDFNLRRLERYLAISLDSGAEPVIILTKSDLCNDIEVKLSEVKDVANGANILVVSSLNNDIESIYEYILPNKTIAFIGSSGVGKSTLINKITGSDIRTGEIRENDSKGRHTTTHRELIELENGAFLMDTPGIREIGMWDNEEGIDELFSDIEELALLCKFSNCTHTTEPGCAIQNAIKEGILEASRYESYLKLKIENKYIENGSSYLQEKKEKFKKIAKMNKKNNNIRK